MGSPKRWTIENASSQNPNGGLGEIEINWKRGNFHVVSRYHISASVYLFQSAPAISSQIPLVSEASLSGISPNRPDCLCSQVPLWHCCQYWCVMFHKVGKSKPAELWHVGMEELQSNVCPRHSRSSVVSVMVRRSQWRTPRSIDEEEWHLRQRRLTLQ